MAWESKYLLCNPSLQFMYIYLPAPRTLTTASPARALPVAHCVWAVTQVHFQSTGRKHLWPGRVVAWRVGDLQAFPNQTRSTAAPVCGEFPLIIQGSLCIQCTYDTVGDEEQDPGVQAAEMSSCCPSEPSCITAKCWLSASLFFRRSALPAQQQTFSTHVALFQVQIGCYPCSPLPSITACSALQYSHSKAHAVGSGYGCPNAHQPKERPCSCSIW